ncbi:GNAT family protein [uncultured Psychroserpens sp.]|uniref:GNAT family N-acetyltransferase n=1 Tax=uncultured Psychroserpens sp. TaxID=255436 RepID=UPI00260E3EF4|nr:GNAT family protein [uncultured Psychroserpens sp.]
MNLKNENVSLRYLEEKDAYTSVKWRNDPKVWELTVSAPDRKILIEDELNWIKKVRSEEDSHRFAILYNDTYVGNIQLTNIKDGESYYGIFIGDTNAWGKGIASKAVPLILKQAFINLNLDKVKIRIRINHPVIFRVHDKLGFKETHRDEELIYMELTKEAYINNA